MNTDYFCRQANIDALKRCIKLNKHRIFIKKATIIAILLLMAWNFIIVFRNHAYYMNGICCGVLAGALVYMLPLCRSQIKEIRFLIKQSRNSLELYLAAKSVIESINEGNE